MLWILVFGMFCKGAGAALPPSSGTFVPEEGAELSVLSGGELSRIVWRRALLFQEEALPCRISNPVASGMVPGFVSPPDLNPPRQKNLLAPKDLGPVVSRFPECEGEDLEPFRARVRGALWAGGEGAVQTAALSPPIFYGMVCVGWSGLSLAGYNLMREEHHRWPRLSRSHNAGLATASVFLSMLGNMFVIRHKTLAHSQAGWRDLFRWMGKVAVTGMICHYATGFGLLYLGERSSPSPSEEEFPGWGELNKSFR